MEYWDLYDKNRNPLGEIMIRGDKIPEGKYHLGVHVWLRNSQGRYLTSLRAPTRQSDPLKWESVGGSVIAGEDSQTGALREVFEEVGIRLNPEDGKVVYTRVSGDCICDVWLFQTDQPSDLQAATTDEVVKTCLRTPEEIQSLLDSGEFVSGESYFMEKVAGAVPE